ncbi:MAG: hypothetical protein QW589_08855, partial [Candidatus Bathyarchaeia archaeon]
GSSLKTDNRSFQIDWHSGAPDFYAMKVVEGEWSSTSKPAGSLGSSSLNATNDPYSSSSHPIYEFRIPMILNPEKAIKAIATFASRLESPNNSSQLFLRWYSLIG